jgi:hypothetical protein
VEFYTQRIAASVKNSYYLNKRIATTANSLLVFPANILPYSPALQEGLAASAHSN